MFPPFSSLVSNLYLWLWVGGAVFLWWTAGKNSRVRRWGIPVLLILWFLGTGAAVNVALRPLEEQYAAPEISSLRKHGVHRVVVLTGGGYRPQEERLHSAFPHASLVRFLGGLELAARLGPDCKIIFSGSAGRGRELTTAKTMEELSRLLSPERVIAAEAESDSTGEHPGRVKPMVGSEPFVLVTSAVHMPRSMRVFRRAGLRPVAYPVDFLTRPPSGWRDWIPSTEVLWKLNAGFREYLATFFYYVKDW